MVDENPSSTKLLGYMFPETNITIDEYQKELLEKAKESMNRRKNMSEENIYKFFDRKTIKIEPLYSGSKPIDVLISLRVHFLDEKTPESTDAETSIDLNGWEAIEVMYLICPDMVHNRNDLQKVLVLMAL